MVDGRSPGETSRDFAAAINAGNIEAALACWAPDAALVAPDGTIVCGEMLRRRFEQLIAGNLALAIHLSNEIEVGGIAMAITRMTMTSPDGQPPIEVHATVVYRRVGDRWRLAIDRIDRLG
jgi:ketosteroid isomerase-like protein